MAAEKKLKTPKKKQANRKKRPAIEREYLTTFSPLPLPSRGSYTDEDSLEQPTELTYVPTRATPFVEAYDLK